MTDIGGVMVVKNESRRFLEAVLAHHSTLLTSMFIVDDGSTDGTFELCKEWVEHTVQRPDTVPSFVEDEASFRQWAWQMVGRHLELNDGDWLFLLDADEFYIPEMGLQQIATDASMLGASSVRFQQPEIWEYTNGLQVRTDGFWAKNRNIRMVKYRRDARFRVGKMGGGSVPQDYYQEKILDTKDVILHFGYLFVEDRVDKYERYTSVKNAHNLAHIDSILSAAKLERWKGSEPKWWRGLSG